MPSWWSAVDVRLRRALLTFLLLDAVLLVGIGLYAIVPHFVTSRVDEAFPTAAAVAPTASAVPAAAQPAAMATPPPPAAVAAASTPAASTPVPATAPAAPPSPPASGAVTAPAAGAEPVALASASFGPGFAAYKGEGRATIFKLADGQLVLRFEDFKVTNGPDLFVYLSGHPAPRTPGQLTEGGGLQVARLKANTGNQNYDLPDDLDLATFKSVVIYCKQFSTVFSTAELAPPQQGGADPADRANRPSGGGAGGAAGAGSPGAAPVARRPRAPAIAR